MSSILLFYSIDFSAKAQIIPDNNLPNNTQIKLDNNTIIIEEGAKLGTNLFHSFQEFSFSRENVAHFNNPLDIQNIFSRVTGASISQIEGILKANGTANLFLLNPNGIIFGENARLDIGGSFLASTANSLIFADGLEFSHQNPQPDHLLSINIPIGLQYGTNPKPISIQGTGHDLIGPPFSPLIRGNSTGLEVNPGNTLAIIGGDVLLDGGIITTQGGQIELGSVADGVVSINSNTSGWKLGYEKVTSFQDITLSNRALVDVSGIGNSSIQVEGRRITLANGSVILNQNQGSLDSGSLNINASEYLSISGSDPIARTAGGIRSETLGFGNSGDITIFTDRINITNGGLISNLTFGAATSGNIFANTSSLEILGFSPLNPHVLSSISTATFGSGDAGNISLATGNFTLVDGANLSSSTFGSGRGGDITLNATNSIEVRGASAVFFQPSIVSSVSLNTGNAGTLIINTPRVVVTDGGRVNAATNASGNSGSLTINSNSVEVIGTLAATGESSQISSSANTVNPVLRELLRLPLLPSGNSGDVTINTNVITVHNGGLIGATNEGLGDAGIVRVNGNRVFLDNEGSIAAATASGEGGNIFLNTHDLRLSDRSRITATAGGQGRGGNIFIKSDTLLALENSNITANAFEGKGGNIQINTQGFFLSPDSRVTASSERGVDGTIEINTSFIDFTKAALIPSVVEVPQVTNVCAAYSQGESGELVIKPATVPQNAGNYLNSLSGWEDKEDYQEETEKLSDKTSQKLVEAQGWKTNPDGTISFTSTPNDVVPYGSSTPPPCVNSSHSQTND
ncbi:two-partner secretion domain-containing protein [Nodularia sp. LEGE 04288]|uniref:two-partner secretion domain-containing protein n=1 Tax=Nodularia sp. LEGE 04288 TaxID=1828639 RepID=UPI0030DCB7DF